MPSAPLNSSVRRQEGRNLLRLSTIPEKAPRGNAEKYFSYREAWTRITAACQQGFFFEAVTIQESIIADRLIDYLVAIGEIAQPDEIYQYPNFANLIQRWKKRHPEPIAAGDLENLQVAVDDWRRARNRVVHLIVKSHPGTATTPIDEFLTNAEDTAHRGVVLAKAVTNWCRKHRPA